jgi:hypothetical protein
LQHITLVAVAVAQLMELVALEVLVAVVLETVHVAELHLADNQAQQTLEVVVVDQNELLVLVAVLVLLSYLSQLDHILVLRLAVLQSRQAVVRPSLNSHLLAHIQVKTWQQLII